MDPVIRAGMDELRALLVNPDWHPSALPVHLKAMLLDMDNECALVRRMRRWYYAVLLNKVYLHDRHSGEPLTVQPVYGDDDVEGDDVQDEEDSHSDDGDAQRSSIGLRVLTWW